MKEDYDVEINIQIFTYSRIT